MKNAIIHGKSKKNNNGTLSNKFHKLIKCQYMNCFNPQNPKVKSRLDEKSNLANLMHPPLSWFAQDYSEWISHKPLDFLNEDFDRELSFELYDMNNKRSKLSDPLGGMIKNYLEIKKYSENIQPPGASSLVATNSHEAFGYYFHAYVFLSLYLTSVGEYQRSEQVLNRTYVKRDQVPTREKLFLNHLHAFHHGIPSEEIMYYREIRCMRR